MFKIWVYALVAILIALAAFVIGQVVPGLGLAFAALGSTLWVAYSVHRGQAHMRNR